MIAEPDRRVAAGMGRRILHASNQRLAWAATLNSPIVRHLRRDLVASVRGWFPRSWLGRPCSAFYFVDDGQHLEQCSLAKCFSRVTYKGLRARTHTRCGSATA